MDQNTWQVTASLEAMLAYVRPRTTARKLRLFVVGCARRITPIRESALALAVVDAAVRLANAPYRTQPSLPPEDFACSEWQERLRLFQEGFLRRNVTEQAVSRAIYHRRRRAGVSYGITQMTHTALA